jgi:DNA-binding MarR family transcriptional regulator
MGTNASPRDAGDSDDTRRVLDAIRRIVQVLRSTAVQAERRAGLSAAQLFVLHKLGDGARISVNDLAARTHTHQSSVSVVVQRLASRGLVRRQRGSSDGRRVELSLTAAGRRKLGVAPEAAQDRLIASLNAMSPAERSQLATLLERFAAGTGIAGTTPALFFEDDEKRATSRRRGGTRSASSRRR